MLQHVPSHLLDHQPSQAIPKPDGFSKALGIEWSHTLDCFCLTIAKLSPRETVTKRALVSDIEKTFDVLGWFAPVIVKV